MTKKNSVVSFLFDLDTISDINDFLEKYSVDDKDTGFSLAEIYKIDQNALDFPMVGEAIAQSYLSTHRACFLPWPSYMDKRNQSSSPTGPDIVGFHKDESGYCFAFGVVKTSYDPSTPPRAINREDGGLNSQLLNLFKRNSIDMLIVYIGKKFIDPFRELVFKEAMKRYARNKADYYVCGFLIRDVNPNKKDLESTVKILNNNSSCDTKKELIALYIPKGSIQKLPEMVLEALNGEVT